MTKGLCITTMSRHKTLKRICEANFLQIVHGTPYKMYNAVYVFLVTRTLLSYSQHFLHPSNHSEE